MAYIDPNITFSPELCNLAIGASVGTLGAMSFILTVLSYIAIIIIVVYLIKKLPEIIIAVKLKNRGKKK